jgi:hypothetical protein
MRDWRKVYRSITSSERLASVSDSAAWLYVLLLVNQDDDGCYPWTPAMVKALTATRDWSLDQATELLGELCGVGAADYTEDRRIVTLYQGALMNGVPRDSHSREPRRYHVTADVRQEAAEPAAEPPLEERRGEETRKEGAPRARKVTSKFIEEMVVKWAPHLGGEQKVREHIADAMNHVAIKKRTDKQQYLDGWLRRDAEGGSNGKSQGHAPAGRASSDSWRSLFITDERAD